MADLPKPNRGKLADLVNVIEDLSYVDLRHVADRLYDTLPDEIDGRDVADALIDLTAILRDEATANG